MPTPVESRKSWPKRYGKWVEQPNGKQTAVLERLAELGRKRAALVEHKSYMTSAGRQEYDQVLAGIRRQITKGVELGIGHEQMREQVGVTSSAYYRIKSGKTGS